MSAFTWEGEERRMRFVVLLRGVNIGGVRFAMQDLAAALAEEGFEDVRTVLASGNVLVTSGDAETGPVARRVSAVIRRSFGFDVAGIATTLPVVSGAVNGYPFPRADDRHAYVVFAVDPQALDALADGSGLDPAVERIERGDDVLYWDVPKGGTLTTAFGTRLGGRQRSGRVTTRNIRTLEKIVAAG